MLRRIASLSTPAKVALGLGVYSGSALLAYTLISPQNSCTSHHTHPPRRVIVEANGSIHTIADSPPVPDSERHRVFDEIAANYDEKIDRDEKLLGLDKLRKDLCSSVRGRVLEFGVGTGRNLAHLLPSQIRSLTLVDASQAMLAQAKQRSDSLWHGTAPIFFHCKPEISLSSQLATDLNGAAQFDSIVQTFVLCSVDDPVASLKDLSNLLAHDGRIFLLEHGRSVSWGWLNWYLDKMAVSHAKRWGCWFNRDIPALLRAADLQIESHTTHHLGTTHMIVARKKVN